jgi:hypothetical protein
VPLIVANESTSRRPTRRCILMKDVRSLCSITNPFRLGCIGPFSARLQLSELKRSLAERLIRAYCFLPSRVMVTGTSVPLGRASDFWTMRNSLDLSSKTMVATEVRTSCPESGGPI